MVQIAVRWKPLLLLVVLVAMAGLFFGVRRAADAEPASVARGSTPRAMPIPRVAETITVRSPVGSAGEVAGVANPMSDAVASAGFGTVVLHVRSTGEEPALVAQWRLVEAVAGMPLGGELTGGFAQLRVPRGRSVQVVLVAAGHQPSLPVDVSLAIDERSRALVVPLVPRRGSAIVLRVADRHGRAVPAIRVLAERRVGWHQWQARPPRILAAHAGSFSVPVPQDGAHRLKVVGLDAAHRPWPALAVTASLRVPADAEDALDLRLPAGGTVELCAAAALPAGTTAEISARDGLVRGRRWLRLGGGDAVPCTVLTGHRRWVCEHPFPPGEYTVFVHWPSDGQSYPVRVHADRRVKVRLGPRS